jgi:hypothetical protein
MAYTRDQLRTHIGNLTGRASETSFDDTADVGINQGLSEAVRLHDFKDETLYIDTLSVVSGDYRKAFPTGVERILHAKYREGSGATATYPLVQRDWEWLELHYPDRDRSSSQTSKPSFFARTVDDAATTYVNFNAPFDASYTVTMRTTHFATLGSSASATNPIPAIDAALVHYGAHWIWESVGNKERSDRALSLYLRTLVIAAGYDMKEPGVTNRFEARPRLRSGSSLDLQRPEYSLSDLQTVYPPS